MGKNINIPHIGEILLEEFLQPLKLSQSQLARLIDVPRNRISEIIRGRRGITPDTSIRLGRLFGVSDNFFLNMQSSYDLRMAKLEENNFDSITALSYSQSVVL